MKKEITFLKYVPDNEQAIIKEGIESLLDIARKHTVKESLLTLPIEVLFANIEAYAMIQPLIDGRGHIIAHRMYFNSNYIFEKHILLKLTAHETLHTLSEINILKHQSLLFKAIALDYEMTNGIAIDCLTTEEIEMIERTMRID